MVHCLNIKYILNTFYFKRYLKKYNLKYFLKIFYKLKKNCKLY